MNLFNKRMITLQHIVSKTLAPSATNRAIPWRVGVLLLSALLLTVTSDQVSAAQVERWDNLSYVETSDHKQQQLEIALPANSHIVRKMGPMPVLVYVHGGAWLAGDKHLPNALLTAYTQQNVIVVSVNYRLGEDQFPQNLHDIISASDWIKNQIRRFGGNPDRMVLTGHSAGAHLVALYAVGSEAASSPPSSSVYRAIVPVDTASFDLLQANTGKLGRLVSRAKARVFGRNERELKAASPLHQIEDAYQAPSTYSPLHLFVTAKRKDAVMQTQAFHDALHQGGHGATVSIIQGGLSHAEMKSAIFDPESAIYQQILHLLLQKDQTPK